MTTAEALLADGWHGIDNPLARPPRPVVSVNTDYFRLVIDPGREPRSAGFELVASLNQDGEGIDSVELRGAGRRRGVTVFLWPCIDQVRILVYLLRANLDGRAAARNAVYGE